VQETRSDPSYPRETHKFSVVVKEKKGGLNADGGMQKQFRHTPYHVRRATCDVLRATCDVRRATCDVLRATCDVRRATCDVLRAATLAALYTSFPASVTAQ
jgi:hypothetical protein